MLVTVSQVRSEGQSGNWWWDGYGAAIALTSPATPVGLFVWGLTEQDARIAEFHAHDEAAWRGWLVRRTTRVIGGRVSQARAGLPGPVLARRATYGRVIEVYEMPIDPL